MFFRRGVSGTDDPWVNQKIGVFSVGAILAMAGMLLDSGWLMGVAAVLLLAGVLLRFIPRGDDEGGDDEGGDDQRRDDEFA